MVFQCTLDTCRVEEWGWVKYRPSLPGNILFLVLFALLIPPQILLGIRHRTAGVTVSLTLGLVMEVIGYIGRILMYFNPFWKDYFLIYLIDLTIAPTLVAAGVYLCLGRVVVVLGGGGSKAHGHVSRWKPRTYTLVFLGWDLLSLILQAIGGAWASLGADDAAVKLGTNIMVAGLSVQVASLFLFMILCAEMAWKVKRRNWVVNTPHADLLRSRIFKVFICALTSATLCIFIRSVFRVAELSEGFRSHLANNEVSFMVLDGTMVIIACITLTVFHPGWAFGHVWREADFRFRTKKGVEGEIESASNRGSGEGTAKEEPVVAGYEVR